MEDLPGDLEKEITGWSLPKPSKRRPKWTLLFVGDDGRTRSIRPFKGLFYLFLGILMISLAANAILYVFHRDGLKEKRRLAGELNQLRQQVDTLRYDKDVLMARMVMTRTRVKDSPPAPKPSEGPVEVSPEPDADPVDVPTEKTAPPKTVAALESSRPTVSADSQPSEDPPVGVSVDELRVSRSETSEKTVFVHFNLRKIGRGNSNVSGRAFVVLRLAKDHARTRNLTIPWASLDDGLPAPTSRGQYFSISRFKPMKFERRNVKRLEQFSRLTVYVFDTAGELMLEKEFPVEITAMAPVEVSTPETETPTAPEKVEMSAPEAVEVPVPEQVEEPEPENNEMG